MGEEVSASFQLPGSPAPVNFNYEQDSEGTSEGYLSRSEMRDIEKRLQEMVPAGTDLNKVWITVNGSDGGSSFYGVRGMWAAAEVQRSDPGNAAAARLQGKPQFGRAQIPLGEARDAVVNGLSYTYNSDKGSDATDGVLTPNEAGRLLGRLDYHVGNGLADWPADEAKVVIEGKTSTFGHVIATAERGFKPGDKGYGSLTMINVTSRLLEKINASSREQEEMVNKLKKFLRDLKMKILAGIGEPTEWMKQYQTMFVQVMVAEHSQMSGEVINILEKVQDRMAGLRAQYKELGAIPDFNNAAALSELDVIQKATDMLRTSAQQNLESSARMLEQAMNDAKSYREQVDNANVAASRG